MAIQAAASRLDGRRGRGRPLAGRLRAFSSARMSCSPFCISVFRRADSSRSDWSLSTERVSAPPAVRRYPARRRPAPGRLPTPPNCAERPHSAPGEAAGQCHRDQDLQLGNGHGMKHPFRQYRCRGRSQAGPARLSPRESDSRPDRRIEQPRRQRLHRPMFQPRRE